MLCLDIVESTRETVSEEKMEVFLIRKEDPPHSLNHKWKCIRPSVIIRYLGVPFCLYFSPGLHHHLWNWPARI
jgi:hypothetical protein